MELKLLHVYTQELGIDGEPSCLISRSDVKDDVSEAVRDKSQHRVPLSRAPPPFLGCPLGQHRATESQASPLRQCQGLLSSASWTSACLIFFDLLGSTKLFSPSSRFPSTLTRAGMHSLASALLEDTPPPLQQVPPSFQPSALCLELHSSLVPPWRQEKSPTTHTERQGDLQFPPRRPFPGAGRLCSEEMAASSPFQSSCAKESPRDKLSTLAVDSGWLAGRHQAPRNLPAVGGDLEPQTPELGAGSTTSG